MALLLVLISPRNLLSQTTATYHLHQEASSTGGLFQLKTAGPDTASLAVQSADLKNQPTGEYLIKAFDTAAGVPNVSGTIASGSTVTLTLWMKKTANFGIMVPLAKVYLNSAAGTLLCTATGSAIGNGSVSPYALNCPTGPVITMSPSDRFYVWVGVNITGAPGNHTVKAELDVEGTLDGNYDSRVVVPMPNVAPTVSVTSPANNATFLVGSNITINATAADSDGTVSKVEFFQGSTKLGEDTTSPYSYTWNNVSVGSYALTGKATDNAGATTTSSTVNISVTPPNSPPTVSITSPANNASFAAGSNITIAATAADSDGTITKVEFFQGSTKLGEATASPYSFAWSNVPTGNYALTAKATDNVGSVTTSGVVNVVVTNVSWSDPSSPAKEYIYLGNRLLATRSGSDDGPSDEGSVAVVPPAIQASTVTFTGTAGQRIAYLANSVTGDPGVVVVISMTAPGGSVVVGGYGLAANQTYFSEPHTLPADGTYTIWVVPQGGLQGGVTLTVYLVPPDTVQTTTPTAAGAVVVVPPTTVPGQNAQITFTGTVGQQIAFLANSVTGDAGVPVSFYLTNPDGSGNGGGYNLYAGQSWFSDIRVLPANGTYTIWLNPLYEKRGGGTVTLYDVPADTVQTTAPTPAGAVVVVPPTTVPGQNARVTFTGTTGQQIAFLANSVTGDAGVPVSFYLTNPDGSGNGGGYNLYAGQSWFSDIRVLPANGTYTIWLNPWYEKRGGGALTLYNVPADTVQTTTPTPGGAVVVVPPTTVPGQNARVTFTGTAGQQISFLANSVTGDAGVAVSFYLTNPDGSGNGGGYNLYAGQSWFSGARVLPVNGTYTIWLNPWDEKRGGATVTVSSP